MRKILVLCYDFPPLPSIGAQRPVSFYTHLPKYGYRPVVITRKWKKNISSQVEYFEGDMGAEEIIKADRSTLIRVPEKQSLKNKLITKYGVNKFSVPRKFITLSEVFLKWIWPGADDKYYLQKRADDYLKDNKVDYILVTGEPFILFKYGYSLSKKFNIPLLLDYRDGWTTNHTVSGSMLNTLRFKFESIFERKYLNHALIYSSVSDGVLNNIENKYTVKTAKKFLLKNGAEINDLKNTAKETSDIFRIVYSGTLYDTSPVIPFLEGARQFLLKVKSEKVKITFIGIRLKQCSHLAAIENFKTKFPDNVEIIDSLPHNKLSPYLVNASLLLLLLMKSQKKGIIGGKTYEYAATRNPILVVQEERTEETPFFQGRDIQAFAFTADEVAKKIELYYAKFTQGIPIRTSITDEEIFSISREYQVKLLAEKLNTL